MKTTALRALFLCLLYSGAPLHAEQLEKKEVNKEKETPKTSSKKKYVKIAVGTVVVGLAAIVYVFLKKMSEDLMEAAYDKVPLKNSHGEVVGYVNGYGEKC